MSIAKQTAVVLLVTLTAACGSSGGSHGGTEGASGGTTAQAGGAPPRTSAQPTGTAPTGTASKQDPCTLVTIDQASAAAEGPVEKGEPGDLLGDKLCTFTVPSGGGGQIDIMSQPKSRADLDQLMGELSGSKPVSGVGDAAFYVNETVYFLAGATIVSSKFFDDKGDDATVEQRNVTIAKQEAAALH